ncbi:MAG: hypothetical protein R2702_10535 [Acidimicrobiales bacterium]
MDRTDRLVALGLAFVLSYLAVLAWHGPESTEEAYPVFNWSLFSEIPDRTFSDYSVRLTSVDGRDLPEPVYFEAARAQLPRLYQNPGGYRLIQQLGSAIDRGDDAAAEGFDAALDERWLEEVDVAEYEVVRRTFDILERRSCDCFTEETVIATGEKG